MKISNGFIKTAFKVVEKSTGRKYDCFLQDYANCNGSHKTRYNIGINGWTEWSFLYYLDEEEFNTEFEVL